MWGKSILMGLALFIAGAGAGDAAFVEWSTYLGGNGSDSASATAVDASGNFYVAGRKFGGDWLPDNPIYSSGAIYLLKFSPSGTLLWYRLRGYPTDSYSVNSIAVDGEGSIYLAGSITSDDSDGFLFKYSASGDRLWDYIFGGGYRDECTAVAIDSDNEVYLAGYTEGPWSSDPSNPTSIFGGYDTSYNGAGDGFVFKFTKDGARIWSTFVGGAGSDYPTSIAVKGSGKVYVGGITWFSKSWVSGGHDTSHNGDSDGFIVKISAAGNHTWSTYLGGNGDDTVQGLALDGSGNLFVTGQTYSANGWISGGFDATYNDGGTGNGLGDAFLIKYSGIGERLWTTYLGGQGTDSGHAVAATASGNVFVAGASMSNGWIAGGFNTVNQGSDGFIAEFAGDGNHLWSSYIGGVHGDSVDAIALSGEDTVFLAGVTASPGWISGSYDNTLGSDSSGVDGFLARVSLKNSASPGHWLMYE